MLLHSSVSLIYLILFRTKEIPKPFVSKIPKPVNSRLSRTPDLSSDKSTAVRRRSLTTAKKKIRNDGMESARSKKELACRLGTTASKDVAQRKKVDEDKLDVSIFYYNNCHHMQVELPYSKFDKMMVIIVIVYTVVE